MSISTRDIQRRLLVERYRRSFCLPNYKPRHWWECDVFELTAAGYFTEFEIKLSLSDFRADATKTRDDYESRMDHRNGRPLVTKHQQLAMGDPAGPSRFYFVAPAGLIPHELIPIWAGLVEAQMREGYQKPWSCSLNFVRAAPRLHHQKFDPKFRQHAESVCYYRMHQLFLYNKIEEELTAASAPAPPAAAPPEPQSPAE